LKALDINEMYIHGTLRLSLGVDVIGKEDYIVEEIKKGVERLREMSPFKFEEGKDE
jgi:cysteine sulfinate desulfinase/cysteine desulfurase-like protein